MKNLDCKNFPGSGEATKEERVRWLCMEEAIDKAKTLVKKANGGEDRRWLRASPPDSYGNDEYRVEIYVCEGSLPKGYVIADYGCHIVKAFKCGWNHLITIHVEQEIIRRSLEATA